MTERRHTPGPWLASRYTIQARGGVDTYSGPVWGAIARTEKLDDCCDLEGRHWSAPGCREANARLIAAAPDMYEALKSLIGSAPVMPKAGKHLIGAADKYNDAFLAAKLAIAKAENGK